MTDHLTKLTDRRSFLRRLLTTTSLVATGVASAPAWAQSHGAHGAHATRPRALGSATPRVAATSIFTPPQGGPLSNPPALIAGPNGAFGLNVSMRQASIGPYPVNLRAFSDANNTTPGLPLVSPTIGIANNGEQQNVSVILTNLLPAEAAPQTTGPVGSAPLNEAPHGFNTINLHTHGLHVDPLQDNVLLELQPAANGQGAACAPTAAQPAWICNGSYTYSYNFGKAPVSPTNQTGTTKIPAGTYWYHPHKHGSVGLQVASGMAGAFIVRGDLDALPGVTNLTEYTMVAQYIPFTTNPGSQAPAVVDPQVFYHITQPTAPINTTMSINGQINPTIAVQYVEIQRWRFVNATAEQFFYLNIAPNAGAPAPGPQLYVIAVDGVPLTNSPTGISVPYPLVGIPSATPSNFTDTVMNEIAILAPGQRLDLLVQAPGNGQAASYLVNAIQWTAGGSPPTVISSQTIATISLAGSKSPADVLPAPALFSATAQQPLIRPQLSLPVPSGLTQNIQFGFTNAGNGPGAIVNIPTDTLAASLFAAAPFALPGATPPAGQLNLKLNAIDRWQVTSDPSFGFGPHAFHIHINSFMMLQRNGIDISAARIWRDTLRIEQGPAPSNTVPNPPVPSVQFVSQQVDYVGDFVLHCHVLQHEDAGMMWSVNIS